MTNSSNSSDPQVLTRVTNGTGILELNRPKALNSLTVEMVQIVADALKEWSDDDSVKQVLVFSNHPKGFCAGGDVRQAREHMLAGNTQGVDEFFQLEYEMNHTISEFSKPYIALMDGIVMGGGAGVSAFGSHRVVTDKTFVSMPEMLIGFVTDVGMTHFFPRMSGARGTSSRPLALYLATTAYRMKAADLLWTGYATDYISSDDVEDFHQAVIDNGIDAALETFGREINEPAPLAEHIETIETVFNHDTWAEIEDALDNCADSDFADSVRSTLEHASSTSLVAAAEIFRANSQPVSLRDALDNEYRLGKYLRERHDFDEGVRCVLVDKDQNPSFEPTTVADVDVDKIRELIR